MRKLNFNGFSATEILLLLVVFGLVTGTGWYVWNVQGYSKKNISSSSNAQPNTTTNSQLPVSNYEDCMKAANSELIKSFPRTCKYASVTFTQADDQALYYKKFRDEASQLFTIKLPKDWKQLDTPSHETPFASAEFVPYEDYNGNYFYVGVDAAGSGVNADQHWTIRKAGMGFRVIQEDTNTDETFPECCGADNRLTILMKSEDTISGHVFVFIAGNHKKESGLDISVYRNLLTSFQAK